MSKTLFSGLTNRAPIEQRAAVPAMDYGSVVPPTWAQLNSPLGNFGSAGQATMGLASVFAAVGIRSDAIGTLPIQQFRGYGDNKTQVAPWPVINNPAGGSNLTQQDFLTMYEACMCLRGNFYCKIVERDLNGFASQLLPIHPDAVNITRNKQSGAIEYRFNGSPTPTPIDDVLHIKGMMMPGMLRALSPVEECRMSFMNARQQDVFIANLYANGGQPSGVLTVQGGLKDSDEGKQVAEQFVEKRGGAHNAGMPIVLPDTITWQPLTLTPADAQWLESQAASIDLVCGIIFRIPGAMYASHTKNAAGHEDREDIETSFVRDTIGGDILRIETALSNLLPRGQYVKLDVSVRLLPAQLVRWQIRQIQRNIGIATPAEIRAGEDMPPVADEYAEWANNPMAPLNSAQSGEYVQPGDETPVQSADSTNPNPNSH